MAYCRAGSAALMNWALCLVQPKRIVQGLHSKFHVFAVDQDRDLDLGCGDDFDIHVLGRQRLEHGGGNACVTAHADAHDRNFGDIGILHQFGIIDQACRLRSSIALRARGTWLVGQENVMSV